MMLLTQTTLLREMPCLINLCFRVHTHLQFLYTLICQSYSVISTRNAVVVEFIIFVIPYKDEQGVGLSNEEIRAEVDTFVFEGHDTTASGLSWTLYNLAIHPEHQAKCREEVDALFDEKENEELNWYSYKCDM